MSLEPFQADCAALGIDWQTPMRKNMNEQRPRWWLQVLRRIRKRIEIVLSQLEGHFGLAKTEPVMPGI